MMKDKKKPSCRRFAGSLTCLLACLLAVEVVDIVVSLC